MSDETGQRDGRLIADALKIRYNPMLIERGRGARLFDDSGKEYLDFGASWAVANLGYDDARVRTAINEQLARTTFAGLISSINRPAMDLAELLVDLTPGAFEKKVWFGLSGSDASEAAQRLVRVATGRPRVLSFVGSWHGTTDATMAMSGHPAFADATAGGATMAVPYPDPYRPPFGGTGEAVVRQCLEYLENYLFRTVCPPSSVAAIFVEALQSDGGDIVPPSEFLPQLRALCDRHGILFVLDDIKVGLGRTGRMFSCEHFDVAPDLLLLGKALGAGLPLSAIVGRREILDAATGAALSTTVGYATGCAAGLAALRAVQADGLVEHAAEMGSYLQGQLEQALGGFQFVGDIRGLGMIRGVDLVQDRTTREPDRTGAARIVYRAWELGLILYYSGNWGNVLELTPPLILEPSDIDRGVAILRQAFEDVVAGRVSDDVVARYAGW